MEKKQKKEVYNKANKKYPVVRLDIRLKKDLIKLKETTNEPIRNVIRRLLIFYKKKKPRDFSSWKDPKGWEDPEEDDFVMKNYIDKPDTEFLLKGDTEDDGE